MKDKPPEGHDWVVDPRFNHKDSIVCTRCGQGMSYYNYLDPDECGDSDYVFKAIGIDPPPKDVWVRHGWALGQKDWNPFVPDDCDKESMNEALK